MINEHKTNFNQVNLNSILKQIVTIKLNPLCPWLDL